MSKKGKGSSKGTPKKKGSVKQETDDDPEPWIKDLSSIVINDSNWTCNVSCLAETDASAMTPMRVYVETANTDPNGRPKMKVLSNSSLAQSTIEKDVEFSRSKPNTATPYMKLCHEAVQYCTLEGFSNSIPDITLAYLIKYNISLLKEKNHKDCATLANHEIRKKKAVEESLMNIQAFVNEKRETGKPKKEKPKKKESPKKKGATETVSKLTDLRKRGEEILQTSLYDEPGQQGPDLYIVITGFYQPQFLLELLKLNVPLVSVVKVQYLVTSELNKISKKSTESLERILNSRITKGTFKRKYSNPYEQFYIDMAQTEHFWKQLFYIVDSKGNVPLFKDTMFMQFYPRLNIDTEVVNPNTSICKEFEQSMYDQFSYMLYDTQDIKREHENYTKLLNVVEISDKRVFSWDKMNLYTSILDGVPPQLLNIPFILNALLCQVDVMNQENQINQGDVFSNKTEEQDGLILLLDRLNYDNDLFVTYTPKIVSNDNHCLDLLVFDDKLGIQTYSSEIYDHVKIDTCKILQTFWEKYLDLDPEFFEQGEKSTDESLFNTLNCIRSRNSAVLDEFSNLACNFRFNVVENKTAVFCFGSSEEVENNNSQSSIVDNNKSLADSSSFCTDDQNYCFKEMMSVVIVQKLQDLFENHTCCDIQRDGENGTLLLKFHDRMTCENEEYFMGTLRTATGLRDFYDYTIEENFDWLDEEEKIYEYVLEEVKAKDTKSGLHQKQRQIRMLYKKIDELCADKNFMKKSNVGEGTQDSSLKGSFSSSTQSAGFDDNDLLNREEKRKRLEAFDIDVPNRVQFSESVREFKFSKHSKLCVRKLSRLYKEDVLAIHIKSHTIALYYFKQIDKEESLRFHLIHDSGMIIFLQNISLERSKDLDDQMVKSLELGKKEKSTDQATKRIFKKSLPYKLSMSWPSTLYFEVVSDNNISVYVKQYYLKRLRSLKSEKYRCYLFGGEILKFMDDDSVTIYYPNSKICHCKSFSYIKKKEEVPVTEHISYEEVKTKNKAKQKPSKSDTKVEDKVVFKELFVEVPLLDITSYEVTLVNGKRYAVENGEETELEPYFTQTFTDVQNGAIKVERSDGTTVTHTYYGTVVEFPDSTRITTTADMNRTEIPSGSQDKSLTEVSTLSIQSGSSKKSKRSTASKRTAPVTFKRTEKSDSKITLNDKTDSFSRASFKDDYSGDYVLVDVQYKIEHPDFVTVSYDSQNEIINLNLPFNTCIHITSLGFPCINFDNKTKITTTIENVLVEEFNQSNLCRESRILPSNVKKSVIYYTKNINNGQCLYVTSNAEVKLENDEEINNVCKCRQMEDYYLIVNKYLNGAQVTNSSEYDKCTTKAKEMKNSVVRDYKTGNHISVVILEPLFQKENSNVFKYFEPIKFFPRLSPPSTYNTPESSGFAPFPKRIVVTESFIPKALLVQHINRLNSKEYLEKQSFFNNKRIGDLLRVEKDSCKALEIYKEGGVRYSKADEDFVHYIRCHLIPHVIALMRRRIILGRQQREIRECKRALREKVLLPYFENSKGVVHLIMTEILSSVVTTVEGLANSLLVKKLLRTQLKLLSEDDLIFMHNMLKQTPKSLCLCDAGVGKCELWITLLAGRTLHDFFPDMISVLEAHSKTYQGEPRISMEDSNYVLIKKLLQTPLKDLSDYNLIFMHDMLKLMPDTLCSCSAGIGKCELWATLLAGRTLRNIYPDMISILEARRKPYHEKMENISNSAFINKLLHSPLKDLSDRNLIFMHDMLKQTPNSICSCNAGAGKCELWATLLAGRTLQDMFPDMKSVLESRSKSYYDRTTNKRDTDKLEDLLKKPTELLTDSNLDNMHDAIRNKLQSSVQLCTCEKDKSTCKLRVVLVAGRTLHYFFPDMASVFISYQLPIN